MLRIEGTQATFDKILLFLLDQGRQASDGHNCLYRAPDGCKCAFGCLIPDETYAADNWEGKIVAYLVEIGQVEFDSRVTQNLCADAQLIHDKFSDSFGEFRSYIIIQFKELARRYDLKMPDVTAYT